MLYHARRPSSTMAHDTRDNAICCGLKTWQEYFSKNEIKYCKHFK